jgi:hypothetical protein
MSNDVFAKFTPEEQRAFDQCSTSAEIAEFLSSYRPAPEQQERDASGRFAARTQATQTAEEKAAAASAAGPRELKQTVNIGGTDFEFTANSAEALELQISSAKAVAAQLTADRAEDGRATARTAAQDAVDAAEAEIALRQGTITTAEYLARTHAVEDALAAKGVDLARVSGEQFTQDWATAGAEFRNSESGVDWPGGAKNQELIGMEIIAMGLQNSPSAESLEKAYASLKRKGLLFEGDHDAKEMNDLAIKSNASPAEILQAWKDAQPSTKNGDATAANEAWIETFRNGRSSTIFGR